MKAIVTGGAGFIGSHLAEMLSKNSTKVTIIDNFSTGRKENLESFEENVKFIECDISKNGNWEKEFLDTDWVFHLASLADIVPSIQKPDDYYKSNVTGTFNVLQACRNNNIKKLVYAASSSCYGIPKKYPTTENEKIDVRYPYALTKRLGEELVMHWSEVYKIPSISLRLFNVYGTRSKTSGTYGAVFGVFLKQKLSKKPLTIVGDGTQTRDFTYVTDVANAFITAAKSKITNEIYNVGSDTTVSVNRIVELISNENDQSIFIPERPGEPKCTYADITKIKNELGWFPKVTIEEGVKLVLENIEYWNDAPLWTEDKIEQNTKDWFKYLG
tara:strand:- start:227 stop:1213 length:987 start_codon:yes stop_codon:yes gene_type:complete